MAFRKTGEERVRYIRSTRFRVLAYGSNLLTITWWFTRRHGMLLLYFAAALYFIAIAPVYPSFSEMRRRRIDFNRPAEKAFVFVIFLGLAGILLLAVVLIVFSRRSLQP